MESTYYVFEYENEPPSADGDFDACFAVGRCVNIGKMSRSQAESIFEIAKTRTDHYREYEQQLGIQADNNLEWSAGHAYRSEEDVRGEVAERLLLDPDETVLLFGVLHDEFISQLHLDRHTDRFMKAAFLAAIQSRVKQVVNDDRDREIYESYTNTDIPLAEIGRQIGDKYGSIISGDAAGVAAKDYHERHFPGSPFPKRKPGRKKKS